MGSREEHAGDRIRDAIRSAGFTQKRLAEQLGVSEQTIRNWIAMRNRPSAENLAAVAQVLDVDRGWLLTGAKGLDEAAILDELRQIRAGQEEILSAIEEVRRNQEAVPNE
jgi:transcriptional regulator with XRE-family HTH domain